MSVILKDMVPRLRVPAYIVATYIALGSFVDMIVSTWPVQLHDLRWRLLFEGLATTASGSEMLAVLLFLLFAWAATDRIALALGFSFSTVVAAAYLCLTGLFLLDSLQIKSQMPANQMARFNLGVAWTSGRLLFSALMFGLFATVAFRAFRAISRATDRGVAAPASNLVVGKSAPASRATV